MNWYLTILATRNLISLTDKLRTGTTVFRVLNERAVFVCILTRRSYSRPSPQHIEEFPSLVPQYSQIPIIKWKNSEFFTFSLFLSKWKVSKMERKVSFFENSGKWKTVSLHSGSIKFEICKFSTFEIWKMVNSRFVRFGHICTTCTPTLTWCLRPVGRPFPSRSDSAFISEIIFSRFQYFKIKLSELQFWLCEHWVQQTTHRVENGKPLRNFFSLSFRNGNSVKWKKVQTFSQPNLENGIPFYRNLTVLHRIYS